MPFYAEYKHAGAGPRHYYTTVVRNAEFHTTDPLPSVPGRQIHRIWIR